MSLNIITNEEFKMFVSLCSELHTWHKERAIYPPLICVCVCVCVCVFHLKSKLPPLLSLLQLFFSLFSFPDSFRLGNNQFSVDSVCGFCNLDMKIWINVGFLSKSLIILHL